MHNIFARPCSHHLSTSCLLCDLYNDSQVKEAKVERVERVVKPPQSRKPLNHVPRRLGFSSQWVVFIVF
ncbi:hypothetical protein ACHAWX_004872 [Stephanocyclus meneghinianus]